jgi:hypothetical protein
MDCLFLFSGVLDTGTLPSDQSEFNVARLNTLSQTTDRYANCPVKTD